VCVSVYVCERESVCVRENQCVCVCVLENKCAHACVCRREKEEHMYVDLCVLVRMHIYMYYLL
jgi:hypothetical protein